MFRLWSLPTIVLGLWLNGSQVGNAQLQPPLSQEHVDAVAAHLSRTMDTTEQAQRNPRFVGVQMTTCPIQITASDDPDSIYLYQEQALTERIESPYRQRFLQITLSADTTRVESRTFKPSTPDAWTGLCQQTNPAVNANELGDLVCVVGLRLSPLGYVGSTPDDGCPVNLRGAVRLTNTIVLHQDGMDTWDRGFDSNGLQVWGAEAEPYQYRWLDSL
ncbi:MAG: chromophore lyase CpcT/CpeT [Leptolyngbyaceae cyanobacterium MAG.088]|nr:chromophore lyase CpcT/CpeT [Leptolyngbyaceae cyanobacterium MAG.088]